MPVEETAVRPGETREHRVRRAIRECRLTCSQMREQVRAMDRIRAGVSRMRKQELEDALVSLSLGTDHSYDARDLLDDLIRLRERGDLDRLIRHDWRWLKEAVRP